MHITIMGPGPQISKMGMFGHIYFFFFPYSRRDSTPIENVERVIFHVKRK